MRAFLAVARREIEEKRFVFVAAAIAGLVPFLAPLVPVLRNYPPDEARDVTALFFACSFGVALALVLGASTIGRDLTEHRLGFYFSRPLSGHSIALGKLCASTLLALVSMVVILIPVTIEGGWVRRVRDTEITPLSAGEMPLFEVRLTLLRQAGLLVLATLVLLLLAHCFGVILRSRSRWLVLDVLGIAVTVLLLGAAAGQLRVMQITWRGSEWSVFLTGCLVLAAAPALLASSIAGVSMGRTDIGRSHKAMSVVLWSCLTVGAIACFGGATWYVNSSPRELVALASVKAAPDGNWLAVSGRASHRPYYLASFLYNASTGAFARVRSPFSWEWGFLSVTFSRDGTRAVWLEAQDRAHESVELVTARLDGKSSEEQRLPFKEWPRFFLSPDGSRLGTISGGLLSVVELPSMQSIFSARLPTGEKIAWPSASFLTREQLLLVRRSYTGRTSPPMSNLSILRVDLGSKRLLQGVEIQVDSPDPQVLLSLEGDQMLVQERVLGRTTLYDCATGAALASIPVPLHSPFEFEALADGRFLEAESIQGQSRLRLTLRSGQIEKAIELGSARAVFLGGQPTEQEVLVVIEKGVRTTPESLSWELLKVNLTSASVVALQKGPLLPLTAHSHNDISRPGSPASRLFLDVRNASLDEVDPTTGARRRLLGQGDAR